MVDYKNRISDKLDKVKKNYGIFLLNGIGPSNGKKLIEKGINLSNFETEKDKVISINGIGINKFKKAKDSISWVKDKLDKIFGYEKKPNRKPNSSYSYFLTNRKQGDWAEKIIKSSLNYCYQIGRTNIPLPEEDAFDQFWNEYQDELDNIGKRPDFLIFDKSDKHRFKEFCNNIKDNPKSNSVKRANAAIEVRSSSYLVKENNFVSITPKLEDLILVYKWIKKFNVKHYYIQIFFNKAYIISFERILDIIIDTDNLGKKQDRNSTHKNYSLSREAKNQFKDTYYIDVRYGKCIGDIDFPKLKADSLITDDGKIILFTKLNIPSEKRAYIDKRIVNKYINNN